MESQFKIGIGLIINYDPNVTKNYQVKDLKRMIKQVKNINSREFRYSTKYYYDELGKDVRFTYFLLEFFSLFITDEFDNEYERLVITERQSLISSYAEAFYNVYDIKTCTKKFIFRLEQKEIEKTVNEVLTRIMFDIELMIFNERLKDVEHDYVLRADVLQNWFFHKLPVNCKGIIVNHYEEEEKLIFSDEFNIPIVMSSDNFRDNSLVLLDGYKEKIYCSPTKDKITSVFEKLKKYTYQIGDIPKYKGTNIKLYAPLVDARQIDKIVFDDWYYGIGPIKSEFLFAVKNEIPSRTEQIHFYYSLFKKAKNKEIIVCIPDFTPYKKSANMEDEYTDIDTLFKHNDLFLNNLYAMADASRMANKRIKVVVPMLRISQEFKVWKETITLAFEVCEAIVPEIGILFETESSFEFFEDYSQMDFAIIGLNNLIEELSDDHDRHSDISKAELMDLLWPHIKDLHQYLRSYKINVRQIVTGNCLINPAILKKFIASGFTEFAISVDFVRLIEDTLEEHMQTRGKFVGVAQERENYKKEAEKRQYQSELKQLLEKVEKLKEQKRKIEAKKEQGKEEHERKKKIALNMILSKKDDDEGKKE
ncbi:MAG: hypothetical protein EP317_00230 [Bacillota bacterium]|nr:MAG: hypothetical protein EP317_00230 [Bacillota bacterium]